MGKLTAAVLLVISCAAVGFWRTSLLGARVSRAKAMIVMVDKIQSCLRYERLTTAQLIETISRLDSLAVLPHLGVCCKSMEEGNPFPKAWSDSVKLAGYTEEEKQILLQVGEILGSTDAQNQISTLSMLREFMRLLQKHGGRKSVSQGVERFCQASRLHRRGKADPAAGRGDIGEH